MRNPAPDAMTVHFMPAVDDTHVNGPSVMDCP